MTEQTQQSTEKRPPFHVEVTDKLVADLQEQTSVLLKPLKAADPSIPMNAATGKPYNGINAALLSQAASDHGYTDNRWVTFKQTDTLNTHIKKGEQSTTIQYWTVYNNDGTRRDKPKLALTKVFNIAQLNMTAKDRGASLVAPSEMEQKMAAGYARKLVKHNALPEVMAAMLIAKRFGANYKPDQAAKTTLIDAAKAAPAAVFKAARVASKITVEISKEIDAQKLSILNQYAKEHPRMPTPLAKATTTATRSKTTRNPAKRTAASQRADQEPGE